MGSPGSPERSDSTRSGSARRWYPAAVIAAVGVVAVIAAIAVAGMGSDGDAPVAAPDLTTTTVADAGTSSTATTGAPTTIDTDGSSAQAPASTAPTTTGATAVAPLPPAVGQGAGCRYLRTDSFDDIQVELSFTSPFPEVEEVSVEYALRDASGLRFVTQSEYIAHVQPGEVLRVEADSFTKVPEGTTADVVTCEVLGIEPIDFGGDAAPPGAGDSCEVLGVDSFGDVQVQLVVTSPFDRVVDVAVAYAVRDGGGARVLTGQEHVETVAPGEGLRLDSDTFTEPPPGHPVGSLSCQVLAIEPFDQ